MGKKQYKLLSFKSIGMCLLICVIGTVMYILINTVPGILEIKKSINIHRNEISQMNEGNSRVLIFNNCLQCRSNRYYYNISSEKERCFLFYHDISQAKPDPDPKNLDINVNGLDEGKIFGCSRIAKEVPDEYMAYYANGSAMYDKVIEPVRYYRQYLSIKGLTCHERPLDSNAFSCSKLYEDKNLSFFDNCIDVYPKIHYGENATALSNNHVSATADICFDIAIKSHNWIEYYQKVYSGSKLELFDKCLDFIQKNYHYSPMDFRCISTLPGKEYVGYSLDKCSADIAKTCNEVANGKKEFKELEENKYDIEFKKGE